MSTFADTKLLSKQRDYWFFRALVERGFPPPIEWLDYKQHQPIPTAAELQAEEVGVQQRRTRVERGIRAETKLERFRRRLDPQRPPAERTGYIVATNGPLIPLPLFPERRDWWTQAVRRDMAKAGLL